MVDARITIVTRTESVIVMMGSGVNNLRTIAHGLAEVAGIAGNAIADLRTETVKRYCKGERDLVTSADYRSHEIIMLEMKQRFPKIPLILEEQTNPPVLPEEYITGDELDGTIVYVNGLSEWCVSLAYVHEGRPAAGAFYQPARGVCIVTWRGGGTWIGDRRIVFASPSDMGDVIALVELNRYMQTSEFGWIQRVAMNVLATRSLASAVASAVEIILGHAAIYINCRGGKVWDFAATALAIEEAGGVVRAADGGVIDWSQINHGVLFATNNSLLKQTLELA